LNAAVVGSGGARNPGGRQMQGTSLKDGRS